MNNRLNNYLVAPMLGAVLFVSSQSSALAQSQIDVTTLGIGTVYDASCENLTIPQDTAAISLELNVWSCDAPGMVFSPLIILSQSMKRAIVATLNHQYI